VAKASATITICRISGCGFAQPVAVAQALEEAGAQLRVRIATIWWRSTFRNWTYSGTTPRRRTGIVRGIWIQPVSGN